jgi:hypothetical protein
MRHVVVEPRRKRRVPRTRRTKKWVVVRRRVSTRMGRASRVREGKRVDEDVARTYGRVRKGVNMML